MKWEAKPSEEEEHQLKTGWLSDNTAFMRMQTQLEKNDIVDDQFFKDFAPRILAFDKFAPLSNANATQLNIERLRSFKADLLEEAGLYDEAIKCSLDSIRDHQNLRGFKGFFQKAMFTERHEMKDETEEKDRAGRFSGLFRKKKEPEQTTYGERPE